MKVIILGEHYLKRFSHYFILITLSLMLSVFASAKVNFSPLFIELSDAMAEVKKGDLTNAIPHLTKLQAQFSELPNRDSKTAQEASSALNRTIENPNIDNLDQLSKALYAFEKEQNPVDYEQKRKQFAKNISPIYTQLNQAIKTQNIEEIQATYKRFNTIWTFNEKVVRETSLGHYGQVETAMTLFRIALLSEPVNFIELQKQADILNTALTDFKAGKVLQPQSAKLANAPQTLAEGITLLEKSHALLVQNQLEQAKNEIMLFIQQWPIFEGDVRTRNAGLYTRIESELPVIMVKGNAVDNLAQFQTLLNDIKQLDISASYNMIDAMLILLREGLEALLIIMALLTALNAAKQSHAKYWVYLGAGLGVIASILGAIALHFLFPAISAGSNREILEGLVGILAVLMMLFVGAWLHSKASIIGWNRFINKQVAQALATGNLVSMLLLSFLTVFREGAETILFYAGMLPLIQINDFLAGIALALLILAILAFIFLKSSSRLPIHHLFKVMTILIYVLGFKILGVSIHALQLTSILPTHIITTLPSLPILGFYASWEGMITQMIYLILIPLVAKLFKN